MTLYSIDMCTLSVLEHSIRAIYAYLAGQTRLVLLTITTLTTLFAHDLVFRLLSPIKCVC